MDDLREVRISISDMDLTADLTPLVGTRATIVEQGASQSVGLKKSKERVLKEITNKLDARPLKLKSTRAGLKLVSGHRNKDLKVLKRAGEFLIRTSCLGLWKPN